MAIGFNDDKVIQPLNSSIFGFYTNKKYNTYVQMEETDLYKKDYLGLRNLNENQKLFRCMVKGGHL